MLAVNVSLGEDADDARRLVASAKGFYARLQRQGITATIPTAQEALRELTPAQHAEPTTIVDGRWPRFVAGDAGQVEQTLRQMLDESAADELMIQNLIADPDDRRASHRRLAELFELPPRRSSAPPPARRTT
jgi:alkanesulfonate monooxygenase SsuD/methylene tetrahydromethanopterin reductase-like flavin-dependent oxidoreductase (luciferase family)